MKDIDLDELDRAVGQMMSQTSTVSDDEKKEDEPKANQPTESGSTKDNNDITKSDESQPQEEGKSAVEAKDPVKKKEIPDSMKKGRVMDFVPANKKPGAKPAGMLASREAPKLQSIDRPALSSRNEAKEEEDGEDDKAPAMNHDAPDLKPSFSMSDMQDQPDEEENHSPFIDTKVEKRPLGAFNRSNNELDNADDHEKEDKSEESKKKDHSEPSNPAPKELSPELLAVEAKEPQFQPGAFGASSFGPLEESKDKPEAKEESATTEPDVIEEPEAKTETKVAPEPKVDLDEVGQMSIPQQYKAPEKQASVDNRPVFDTKDYHAPLPVQAKKTHSHLGFVFLVVFLLLIVAAGVVTYLVMDGQLSIPGIL